MNSFYCPARTRLVPLLFERAIREFSPADAQHLRTTGDSLELEGDGDRSIRLEYLARLALNRHDVLAHPDRDDDVPIQSEAITEVADEEVHLIDEVIEE